MPTLSLCRIAGSLTAGACLLLAAIPVHAAAPLDEALRAATIAGAATAAGSAPAPGPDDDEQPDDRRALEDELFGGGDDDEPDDRRDLEDEMFGGDDDDEADPDDRRALEDDLFGGGDDRDERSTDEPTDDDDDTPSLDGQDARGLKPSRLLERLDVLDEDPLAIGGQLFSRLQYDFAEGQNAETSRLSSPNLLDVYLDARPTDRLRAFARARVRHDFTLSEQRDGPLDPDDPDADPDVDGGSLLPGASNFIAGRADETTVALDQLWLKFDIARVVYVTFGRQAVRWGTGRFWNPTDFLNRQTRDPLAVFDERLGVSLLRLHVPIEALDMNIFAVAILEDADSPARVGAALRWEWLVDLTEIAVSAAVRKDEPLRLGLDVSSGLWLFDVRLEGAATYDDDNTRYWRGELDFESLTVPTAYTRDDEWTFQVVAGADLTLDYGDQDSLIIGAEYFFNQPGYTDSDLNPWILFNGDFRPLNHGRHYAAAYALLAAPGDWDDTSFTLSTLGNLTDPTFLTRLDYRVTLLTYLSVVAWGSVLLGKEGGELRPALSLPPLPLEGLENGLEVPPPLFQLGVGALLRI